MKFSKMHGLGNDFIVIDGVNQSIHLSPQHIQQLANRHTGVGFDQCLIVEQSTKDGVDFFYRIINADGSEVGQCGNGARCLARFIKRQNLSDKHTVTVATKTSCMALSINVDDSVSVRLPPPHFEPAFIPLLTKAQSDSYQLPLKESSVTVHALSVGNPHGVVVVDDVFSAPVANWGRQLSHHSAFPERANIGFMQLVDSQHIKLRVYERGVGETQACGSGAVAAAVCAIAFHNYQPTVKVGLTGGELSIQWQSLESDIVLTGPAEFVFDGEII